MRTLRRFTGLCLLAALAGNFVQAGESTLWEPLKLPSEALGVALHGVYFLDAKSGWIVGEKGLCLATADGGQTWERRESGSGATLRDVRFKDATHGWACGDGDPKGPPPRGHVVMMPGASKTSGTLLITEDGGKTWQNFWVPTNFEIPCVEPFAAPLVQLGNSGGDSHLDGDNLRCSAGKAWQSERVFRAVLAIRAVDAQHWVAAGSPVAVGFMPTPDSPLYTNRGCRALFSKDGGKTWQPSKGSEGKGRGCLRGLAVKAGQPVLAVGDGGSILRSADSGETWEAAQAAGAGALRAVAYAQDDAPLAVAVGKKGAVAVSLDFGKTWTAQTLDANTNLLDVAGAGSYFIAVTETGMALRAEGVKLAAAPPGK